MENVENLIRYSPIIMLVLVYFIQLKIFVTPETLEKKHREIIQEAENRFASKVALCGMQDRIGEIKEKIDKIYDYFLANNQ